MASRLDAALLAGAVGLALLGGCRSRGLPSQSPQQDATNPDAATPAYELPQNPMSRSAFEGVKLDAGGGHAGHGGHGGHGGHAGHSSK
ncbi:MAG: hypothetical protein AAF799_24590 [Myxococcota bacterium]